MRSSWIDRVRGTLGFRLALWYTALFAAGTIALFGLAYALLAASLERRDHDAVRATLAEYVSTYAEGGLRALLRTINTAQQMGSHADLFVRVAATPAELKQVLRGSAEVLSVSDTESDAVIKRERKALPGVVTERLAAVLDALAAAHLEVLGVETREHNLEHLFLELTGRKLRD